MRRGTPFDRIGLVVARPLALSLSRARGVRRRRISRSKRSTRCRWPPSRMPPPWTWCSNARRPTSRRRALMALLRSPHFRFDTSGGEPRSRGHRRGSTSAWPPQRYLGGLDRLTALTAHADADPSATPRRSRCRSRTSWRRCSSSQPLADQVDLLRQFLERHDRPFDSGRVFRRPPRSGPSADHQERRRRARGAVMITLEGLAAAFRRHDPAAVGTVVEVTGAVRRWIGAQTFATDAEPRAASALSTPSRRASRNLTMCR